MFLGALLLLLHLLPSGSLYFYYFLCLLFFFALSNYLHLLYQLINSFVTYIIKLCHEFHMLSKASAR